MDADNCAPPPGSIPKEEDVMRWIVSLAALALAESGPTAMAQTTAPGVSAAPSAQNSAAGIAGQEIDVQPKRRELELIILSGNGTSPIAAQGRRVSRRSGVRTETSGVASGSRTISSCPGLRHFKMVLK